MPDQPTDRTTGRFVDQNGEPLSAEEWERAATYWQNRYETQHRTVHRLEDALSEAQRERDEARKLAKELYEALRNIRGAYFPADGCGCNLPHDEDPRVQWARQTFEIAKAACDSYEASEGTGEQK